LRKSKQFISELVEKQPKIIKLVHNNYKSHKVNIKKNSIIDNFLFLEIILNLLTLFSNSNIGYNN
jgi:hypothetical protein